jgi:hypothetical protein
MLKVRNNEDPNTKALSYLGERELTCFERHTGFAEYHEEAECDYKPHSAFFAPPLPNLNGRNLAFNNQFIHSIGAFLNDFRSGQIRYFGVLSTHISLMLIISL